MTPDPTRPLRDALREAYHNHAEQREASETQDWKTRERGAFLDLLKHEHKASLLEIGAGVGHDSLFFQDQSLAVTAIDLTPAMVALCRQKGLKAYVMDMTDLCLPDESFDAVYALNSLLHLPKAEFPLALSEIWRVLRPGGLAFIGVYGGYDFEGIWDSDPYVPQRFFSFFTDERIEQEVSKLFAVVSFNRVYFGPEDPIHFQALTLRK